ncbi:MAG TPA: hypothetical protein VM013_07935 [Dehalococcoidia bacterium]|nr:hypothetical protein [Dehalococcoidia bacterium]HUV47961.1 hypothetical protein [Actinomycetes bacterium]
MVLALDEFLDDAEHDAKNHAGIPGVGVASVFGDGSLGDFVLTSYLETSGELHYNSLVVGTGGDIGVEAQKKLTIRTKAACTVDPGRSIHADGRGWSGQAGAIGGSRTTTIPTAFAPGSPGFLSPGAPHIAGAGGGGGAGGPCFPGANRVTSGDGGSTTKSTLDGMPREFSAFDTRRDSRSHSSALVHEIYDLSIPANTLLAPGDYLDVEVAVRFTDINSLGTMSWLIRWGGVLVVDLNSVPTASGAYNIILQGRIYFLTPTTQACVFTAYAQNDAATPFNNPPLAQRRFITETSINTGLLQSITVNADRTSPVSDAITGQTAHVRLVSPTSLVPVVGGRGEVPVAGPSGIAGANGPALTAIEIAQATADFAAMARALTIFGSGGAGGAGGSGFDIPPVNTPGVPGSVTGPAGFGNGGNGVYNSPSDFGGSGAAGGAGGGHLVLWCGGDLTIGAGGRISANGGAGGNGSSTGNSGGGEGGGGGGGGGGFVGAFHGGAFVNNGTFEAAGGLGGFGNTGFGQDAGSGGNGSDGIAVARKVA